MPWNLKHSLQQTSVPSRERTEMNEMFAMTHIEMMQKLRYKLKLQISDFFLIRLLIEKLILARILKIIFDHF